MRQIPRLFVEPRLSPGLAVPLAGGQAHYLANVLRLAAGAPVALLDDATGEWRAVVEAVGKRKVQLRVEAQLRPRESVPDLWLLTAPIRRERFEWIVEKATELGVARIVPVLTERTVRERLNPARLRAHMVEAAEQCERTALPELAEATPLAALIGAWPAGRRLYVADEAGGAPMAALGATLPAAILIGPEGGFADAERARLLAVPGSARLTLGPNILRADTAVVAAIAQFQALGGS
jgi:16S rRNA (uracil1498-N3)-methyltransferase